MSVGLLVRLLLGVVRGGEFRRILLLSRLRVQIAVVLARGLGRLLRRYSSLGVRERLVNGIGRVFGRVGLGGLCRLVLPMRRFMGGIVMMWYVFFARGAWSVGFDQNLGFVWC